MNRTVHQYRQLKLTNGDEIIAEVVQWNDDDNDEVVVKNAMRLVMYESADGQKFFSFRPFMVYQEGEEDLIVIMCNHIVSIALPIEVLLVEYRKAMDNMHVTHLDRIKGNHKEMSYDDLQKMTRETLDKMAATQSDLEAYLMELESATPFMGDSDGGNVVDIFSKKTLH